MIQVSISEVIAGKCPELHVAVISCDLQNRASNPQLWQEIQQAEEQLRSQCTLQQANKLPSILATRQAYKACGKDPNRYRPSAESLRRRVLRDLPLYRIDTLVDVINLISLVSGYSIGGFDADKIIEWCLNYDVNQIYVIGGDGTHRGATVLFEELEKRVFLPFPFLFVEPEHRCSWCSQDH